MLTYVHKTIRKPNYLLESKSCFEIHLKTFEPNEWAVHEYILFYR